MLHIVSASPYQNSALRDCLKIARDGDAILLLADAVYAVKTEQHAFHGLSVFALSEHIQARGIARPEWIEALDYDGMVQLTCRHHPVQSWA